MKSGYKMKSNKLGLTLLGLTLAACISSCANKTTQTEAVATPAPAPAVVAKTTEATALSGGSDYTMIQFKKGSTALTEAGKIALRNLSEEGIKSARSIDDIKVLAWADREYPSEKAKATRRDVKLADERAAVIKTYLKDDLKVSASIDNHNMAKRPGLFSEMMKSDDYKVKKNFEATGAAPTTVVGNEKRILGKKVSKAVVFIKYK
jgi:hypothetical protein